MLNGKSYITINTDASYNHQTKEAGLSFYLIIDRKGTSPKRVRYSMYVPDIIDHNAAEYWAVIYALTYVIKYNEYSDIDYIVINTDSMAVIQTVNQGLKNSKLTEPHTVFTQFASILKRKIRFKHVKAHTKGKDPRTYINNWCDEAAKKARKKGN